MTPTPDPQAALRTFPKTREFFIGIDSDGCAFDTMEVKHKECFIPQIVRIYRMAAVSKYVREAAEFVNLYSRWRGTNRFMGLVLTMHFLSDRREVDRMRFRVPPLDGLCRWLDSETILSNSRLQAEVARTGDPDLGTALEWSEAVNRSIAEVVRDVPPFLFVEETLEKLSGLADLMVCSATPTEALTREWEEHGLRGHVALIAGQELGGKAAQMALAASGYDRDKVLMVGDAPGDRMAAETVGALFYPIEPGNEEDSWRRLQEEALPRFFKGAYAGPYMADLLARFEALLPEKPPWKSMLDPG